MKKVCVAFLALIAVALMASDVQAAGKVVVVGRGGGVTRVGGFGGYGAGFSRVGFGGYGSTFGYNRVGFGSYGFGASYYQQPIIVAAPVYYPPVVQQVIVAAPPVCYTPPVVIQGAYGGCGTVGAYGSVGSYGAGFGSVFRGY